MELNYELELARRCIENTNSNLFLTGRAGTGKTTFLQQLKAQCPKRMVVLAPTGIAAINAGGVTIHSFFQLPFAPYIPNGKYNTEQYKYGKEKINIIRSLNLLVIDEISMVRADLLDAVDMVLRKYRHNNAPFGGVQLLLIGDIQQLAPVAKKEEKELLKDYYNTLYFFGSLALQQTDYITIELKKVYRQNETSFLHILNAIRDKQPGGEVLEQLNARCVTPDKKTSYVRLTTHNAQADKVNMRFLNAIKSKAYSFDAEISGSFPESSYPTEEHLVLKKGAQVMFLKNASGAVKKYYNGKIGTITDIGNNSIKVCCQGETDEFEVEKEEWTNARYVLNKDTNEISEEIEGTFKQYPLRLAWAITIHKSQGLTFDHVIVDAAAAFAHGQVYVALSRCRTLSGLVLSTPISKNVIIKDYQVDNYTRYMQQHQPDEQQLQAMEKQYYFSLLKEQFDFDPIYQKLQRIQTFFAQNMAKDYPQLLTSINGTLALCNKDMITVAHKFEHQYTRLYTQAHNVYDNPALQERIRAAATYFTDYIVHNLLPLNASLMVESDNSETEDKYEHIMDDFALALKCKLLTLSQCTDKDFSAELYTRTLSEALIQKGNIHKALAKMAGKSATTDILHMDLYEHLKEWRAMKAAEMNMLPYRICHNKALIAVSNLLPQSEPELKQIPHMGKKTIRNYGAEILDIVAEFIR